MYIIYSTEFSSPEYWIGYPFPSPWGLPNPRGNPGYPELQVDLLPAEPQGKYTNPRVFILSHLQQIFPGQDSHQGILHCRWILYQQSYQGSPLVPFSSVPQSYPTLCDPMDCSTTGFLVQNQHPVLAQTHVHQVADAIQLSHPLWSPSPLAFNLPSIRVFYNESVLCIRWPKYWSFSFSQPFQ